MKTGQDSGDVGMWLASLGTSLRTQRQRVDMSVAALATELDVSVSTVKKMERGDAGVALQTWVRAWTFFRVMPRVAQAAGADELVTFQVVNQVAASMRARDPNRYTPPAPSGPIMTLTDLPGARLI